MSQKHKLNEWTYTHPTCSGSQSQSLPTGIITNILNIPDFVSLVNFLPKNAFFSFPSTYPFTFCFLREAVQIVQVCTKLREGPVYSNLHVSLSPHVRKPAHVVPPNTVDEMRWTQYANVLSLVHQD